MEERYDVVIIGGGPAGTTCGTRLVQRGYKVLILERYKFPRFHIGESITAFGFTVFKDLGVYDELKDVNYVKKKGLEFVMHEKTRKIYFLPEQANEPGEKPWAFQMARGKLDKILLDNARRQGVEVREEHLVKRVLFEGDRAVGVEYKDLTSETDEVKTVYGRWILDASGQGAILNHQFKDNWYPDPLLEKKMAVFCHWTGDIEVENTDHDLNFKLCVHQNRRDWAWYIPIDKNVLSLGVVLSQPTVREETRSKSLDQIFYDYARDIPYISDILKNKTLKTTEKFRCVKDYSYRSKSYYGNGWAIVGDSAGFIDPVFSTGLQVAFNSAYALIDPLDKILRQKGETYDLSPLESYNRALDRYYRVNSMLVYIFYMCKLDHEYFHSASYLWKNIQWAGISDRLAFLWHGLRYRMADKETRLHWGIQVLFGNPAETNVVADLYMALSRNYDKVFRDKIQSARQGSTTFVEA